MEIVGESFKGSLISSPEMMYSIYIDLFQRSSFEEVSIFGERCFIPKQFTF